MRGNGSLKKNWNKTGKHREKCRVFSREMNIHNVQGDYVNLLLKMSVARFIEVDKCY